MESNEILENLEKIILKDRIKQDEPMKNHTSFKIGGPAEFFINITNIDELVNLLKFTKENNIPLTLVGNGSNLLVSDTGIKGIVIKLDLKDIKIENARDDNKKTEVVVESGVLVGFLAQKLLQEEITGFEELSGIPGTIGGAITMNAGAHGKEIKDIIEEVTAIDYNGNIYNFRKENLDFSYRHSRFLDEKYIITSAKFILEKGNKEDIKEKMDKYLEYRKEKQPVSFPSAGSTFKRGDDFITAKLIDDAGLKGYSIGGAKVSDIHSGFIVNTGNATADDVLKLVEYIKKVVKEKFDKDIELEVQVIE